MEQKTPRRRGPMMMPLEKRLMLDASLPVLTGQVLWLDAADKTTVKDSDGDNAATGTGGANNGFGGGVATWMDKSGSGYNLTNATAGQQPTYVNTKNGNSVITFDGTNDKLTNAAVSVTGNAYTTFIVFDRTNTGARSAVFELGGTGTRNALYSNNTANKLSYYLNSAFIDYSTNYTSGNYTVTTLTQNNTAITGTRDGTTQISTTGVARATTTGLYIGDDSTGGDPLQGHIAEMIVYNRALTADERHDVETYLAGKWGLTITDTAPVQGNNTGATTVQGTTVTITNTMLSATDADNSESMLQYKITDLSDYGALKNSNTAHTYALGEYFTQADVDAGYIRYTHDNSTNFADSFSFTVSDQYATTSAATFNLTITPSNHAPTIQGWTQTYSENFESGATGWSDNTTDISATYLSRFLGRHSLEAGAQNTYKTYAMTGTQDYTVVSFDVYKIDSWDGEFFKVFINDTQVINIAFSQSTFATPVDGTTGAVSYTIQETTPFLANFAFGTYNDQMFRFTLTVANSAAANMKIGFSSTLDQATSDESWGVDNVVIYEAKNGGVPGPVGIIENSANGTVVGQVTAADQDVGQTIAYSIVGGTGASVFSINATTGVITVANSAALNYESVTSYTLDIRATDNGTPSYFDQETMTINVLDLPENTAPSIAALGPLTVAENAANNTVVGTAIGSDPEGNTITYSITAGNTDSIFAINAATGAIRVNSNTNLNYDFRNTYTLTIQAQDNGFGSLTGTRNVVVNVTNVNEAPTFDIPQSFLNQNPYLRYNATTGNFYQYVSTTANYTAATTAAGAATLNGIAGHLATITSAAENTYVRALGGNALWLGASDAVTEGTWIWAGSGPESGAIFSSGAVAQNGYYTNWLAGQPDNSSNEDHLEMSTAGTWNDALLSVAKNYVIEWEGAAVMAALGNGPFTLAENATLGQVVGSVNARDADAGDTLTYSITGGTGSAHFAVDSATGQITLTNPSAINYEAASSYTLNMRVQDAGGLFNTQTVTINIGDVNETPVLDTSIGATLNEGATVTITNAMLSSSDVDTPSDSLLVYTVTNETDHGILFNINTNQSIATGQTFTQGDIDAGRIRYIHDDGESTADAFTFTVNDGAITLPAATFNITINAVNEGPSFDAIQALLDSDASLRYDATTGNFYKFVPYSTNIAAAQANAAGMTLNGVGGYVAQSNSAYENALFVTMTGTVIWLGGSDAGTEGTWVYDHGANAGQAFWQGTASGSAQNGNYTNWNGGEPNQSGDEDYIQMYSSGLWNDAGGGAGLPYIVEWDGAAVLAGTTNGPYAINENSALNTVVGPVHAADYDAADVLTYSITGGTGAGVFAINSATGAIRLNGPINYEAVSSYTLDLRVQDSGGLFDTVTITVNINDINDVPDNLSLAGNTIVENSAIGTLIGTLATVDQDTTDTPVYTLVTNPSGKFVIVGNELRTAADIDYEINQNFNIVIRTNDGHGGTLDRTFGINVGDVMDTFTPPPSTGSTGGFEPFIPAESEDEIPSINIISASFGGEGGQFDSFYGHQILRENITFKIREILDTRGEITPQIEEEITGYMLDNMFDTIGLIQSRDTTGEKSSAFTNIREALSFLQQMADSADGVEGDKLSDEQQVRAEQLPLTAIDRQFVDVMTYHKDRAARLREALIQKS